MPRRKATLECPYCRLDVAYERMSEMPSAGERKQYQCTDPDAARNPSVWGATGGCSRAFEARYDPTTEMYITEEPD